MKKNIHKRRKAVHWFSGEMEKVLRENDYKGGWNDCTFDYLFSRLNRELFELAEELKPYRFHCAVRNPQKIIKECCDVANFAMMIADGYKTD